MATYNQVGDHPASDMQGVVNVNAHNANIGHDDDTREEGALGAQWHGALVKTGVYTNGQTNDATLVVEDVVAAVDAILARHNLQ
jgi:ribonucleotide monophosphatase NagD (HAD superfamily)